MELYSGLDLHSTNTYIGILDPDFNHVFKKRVSNNLDLIAETLEPFKDQLKGLLVESTYNWYWLVDGLMDNLLLLKHESSVVHRFLQNLFHIHLQNSRDFKKSTPQYIGAPRRRKSPTGASPVREIVVSSR